MSRIIVPGPKVMLVGGSGGGKTHSLRTIVESGLKLFVVFTEPGMEVLADIPCASGLHWRYIPPSRASWAELLDATDKINKFSFKALAEMPDINKSKYREFYDFIACMANLKCDRCGQTFGPADQLGEGWAVANDSLSGISTMDMNLVVGGKPVASQSDWGVAMKNLENYIIKFCGDIQCLAVMIAHLEREADEVTGAMINMPSTLGKKLAPKIPRYFSDVIHAKRDGNKFSWSTATINTDLKSRHLQIAEGHPPSFKPLVEAWRKKLSDTADAQGANQQIAAATPAVQR